jgi:hypothetical protein
MPINPDLLLSHDPLYRLNQLNSFSGEEDLYVKFKKMYQQVADQSLNDLSHESKDQLLWKHFGDNLIKQILIGNSLMGWTSIPKEAHTGYEKGLLYLLYLLICLNSKRYLERNPDRKFDADLHVHDMENPEDKHIKVKDHVYSEDWDHIRETVDSCFICVYGASCSYLIEKTIDLLIAIYPTFLQKLRASLYPKIHDFPICVINFPLDLAGRRLEVGNSGYEFDNLLAFIAHDFDHFFGNDMGDAPSSFYCHNGIYPLSMSQTEWLDVPIGRILSILEQRRWIKLRIYRTLFEKILALDSTKAKQLVKDIQRVLFVLVHESYTPFLCYPIDLSQGYRPRFFIDPIDEEAFPDFKTYNRIVYGVDYAEKITKGTELYDRLERRYEIAFQIVKILNDPNLGDKEIDAIFDRSYDELMETVEQFIRRSDTSESD